MYTFDLSPKGTLDVITETALYELAQPLYRKKYEQGSVGHTWNDSLDCTEEGDLVTVSHALTPGKVDETARELAGTFWGLEMAGRELELPKPDFHVWLYADNQEQRFKLDITILDRVRNRLSNYPAEDKEVLAKKLKMGMWQVACLIEPTDYCGEVDTNSYYPFDAYIHSDGRFHLSCPGDDTGLDPYLDRERRELRLVPHNLDLPSQQLMLMGGLAVLASQLRK